MAPVEEERAKSRWGLFQFMTRGLSAILMDFSLIVLDEQPVCTKSGHEPWNSKIYRNEWRDAQGDVWLDLGRANLSGTDLSGANLGGVVRREVT